LQTNFLQDWATVPKAALSIIFNNVFKVTNERYYPSTVWPLKDAVAQLTALSLVCKPWRAALVETPPTAGLKLVDRNDYRLAKRIPAFTVKTLKLLRFIDDPEGEVDYEYEFNSEDDEPRPHSGRLSVDCLKRLKGTYDIRIGEMHALESLTIESEPPEEPEPARSYFNTIPIQSLKHLKTLKLIGFHELYLGTLPLSVRDLTLAFGLPIREEYGGEKSMSTVPRLPENLHLDKLKVISERAVGIALHELWDCCTVVEIDAYFGVVGVGVRDRNVISQYEKAYRDKKLLQPPERQIDEDVESASYEAMQQTLDCMLTGIASSRQLKVLRFGGGCAEQVHFVPARVGMFRYPDSIRRIFQFLYEVSDESLLIHGASGEDIVERWEELIDAGTLPESALEINLEVEDYGEEESEEEEEGEEDERIASIYHEYGWDTAFQVVVKKRIERKKKKKTVAAKV
jgi:hypothetical protein